MERIRQAKTVITGPNGQSTATAANHTEGPYAPVFTGRRKDDGHGG